jgi:hypothetical protein
MLGCSVELAAWREEGEGLAVVNGWAFEGEVMGAKDVKSEVWGVELTQPTKQTENPAAIATRKNTAKGNPSSHVNNLKLPTIYGFRLASVVNCTIGHNSPR